MLSKVGTAFAFVQLPAILWRRSHQMRRLRSKRTQIVVFIANLGAACISLATSVPLGTKPGLPGNTLDDSAPPSKHSLASPEFTLATGDKTTVFTVSVVYSHTG